MTIMSRNLTTQEINNILLKIDHETTNYNIPKAIRTATLKSIQDNIREQLETISIHPKGIPKLESEIIRYYHSSQIDPGASVGIVTAQSIGERQTQMTLNTFHSAGMAIATVITGVPRFGELLNATTNPKMVSCQIYFKDQDHDIESLRQYIGSDLRQFTLKDLEINHHVSYKSTPEHWYEPYLMFTDPISYTNTLDMICGTSETTNYLCCTVNLNHKILYEYIISLQQIVDKLTEEYDDIIVIPSPVEKHRIDIFIDVEQITDSDNNFGDITMAHKLYIDNVVIPSLFDIVVAGIPGITNFFFKKYNANDQLMSFYKDYKGNAGWMVETQGCCYSKLLSHPKMRTAILISNNMWDIYEALGIEAARQFLIDEFMNVVSSDGTYINICHVMLLVDLMTFSGSIASISRYGIKRDQAGPLAKASFEESLDNFLKAGVFGDIESTNGVSASIMCGKRSKIGTGLCDLLYKVDGSGSRSESATNTLNTNTPTLSTDPVKETVFTDLSKWMKAHTKTQKQESDTEDASSVKSDDSESLGSEILSEDNSSESNDDSEDESSESGESYSGTETIDLSSCEDEESDVIDDDIIFDDKDMDSFMGLI